MIFFSDQLDQNNVHRQREQMTSAAFTAYLQGSAGKDISWKKYMQSLGLAEKEKPISKDTKKKLIQESKRIAEKIMRMDKVRKNKNAKRDI